MTQAFEVVAKFLLPYARTWGLTGGGKRDRDRIRFAALQQGLLPPATGGKYRIEITVTKSGARPFDIENVVKPIIDAFSRKQILVDGSEFPAGLYDDDTIDHVTEIVVRGQRASHDSTQVTILRTD